MKGLINTIFLLLVSVSLYSQLNFSHDTIVVSAMQMPLKINETGRNITVINSKQIAALPATSLDEILQTVSGLEVQSRGGFGVQSDILLRGSTFTQVLVLVDGVKVNDALTGHFNGYVSVSPGEIERIEILRGAAAAMYGADAVGGVINILTKTFANTTEGTEINGAFNVGQHQLVNGNQSVSIRKGPMSFGAGFSVNQSIGEEFQEQVLDATTTLDAYNSFFDIKNFGASFAYRLTDNLSIKARSSYSFHDFDARYFYTTSPFDKSTEKVKQFYNHLQLVNTTGKGRSDFNLAYKYNTDEFIFSPDFPSTNNHLTQYLNFTANHLQYLSDKLSLKTGVQVDQRKIESNDRGDHSDLHYGLYVMGAYQQKDLNLSVSLRGDYDENYSFEFTPQFNFSYVFPRLVVRASGGRSIRAADYTERYVSNNLQNLTPNRSLGNPDLLAESSWSEELGIDFAVNDQLTLKTTVFARQSKDLIDYVSTNESEIGSVSEVGSLQEGADYFFARNISEVSTNGVEFEARYIQPVGDAGRLAIDLGYTFLDTSNDEATVYISSHAKHLITSQFQLNIAHFDFVMTGLYKERNGRIASSINSELTEDYLLLNGRIGHRLTDNVSLNLQLHNITNIQYQNILGARMPSRWFMAGVKWTW